MKLFLLSEIEWDTDGENVDLPTQVEVLAEDTDSSVDVASDMHGYVINYAEAQQLVRLCDLSNQVGSCTPRPILHCSACGSEYSADRGDYFMMKDEEVFRCEDGCDTPLSLVTKGTTYTRVQ